MRAMKTQHPPGYTPGQIARQRGRPSETLEWQPRYEWGKGKATTQAKIDYVSMNLKGLATGIQRGGTGNARF